MDYLVRNDVLMRAEIVEFQGKGYQKAEALFYRYFAATLVVYLLLASTAFVLLEIYALRLLTR